MARRKTETPAPEPTAAPARRGRKAAQPAEPAELMTLSQLAESLGVEPGKARQRMRAAYPDHQGRWKFAANDPKLAAYKVTIQGPQAK